MTHTKKFFSWFYGFNISIGENKGWQNYRILLTNLVFKFSLPASYNLISSVPDF